MKRGVVTMKRFIILLVVIGAALPLVLASCPEKFFSVGGSCYYFPSTGPWLWEEARNKCKEQGADLAILDTPQELVDLSSVLERRFSDEANAPFYIGGYKKNGIWTWVNGDRMSTDSNVWVPSEPNDSSSESYVLMIGGNAHGRRYFVATDAHVGRFLCET